MEGLFSTVADMANRSTLYKRHETRNKLFHNNNNNKDFAHSSHEAIDDSVMDTLWNLPSRSTIYKARKIHHEEMHHHPHAGLRHMPIHGYANNYNSNSNNNTTGVGGVLDALSQMTRESTIFRRNSDRNKFLHA